MSSLITQVRQFTLSVHPNADTLSLATPHGTDWQCCARTADFENESLALYIPIDTLVPNALATEWGLPVKDGKDFRIKTIRLRGELSQGLMVPNKGRFAEGEDVSEALGLTKYEAPEPGTQGPNRSIPQPEGFDKYTDIENIKNFPNVLKQGEQVVITEKLHGSNARMGWVDGTFYIGSRRMVLAEGGTDQWCAVAEKYGIAEKLLPRPGFVVYGELLGPGVQKLAYDLSGKEFFAFDVWDGEKYLDPADAMMFCCAYYIPFVPVLYIGPYSPELLELRNGKSTIAGHLREGIVIKPAAERWDSRAGRVALKSVSEAYLLGNWDE